MKKWMLCMVLLLGLVACGGETSSEAVDDTDTNEPNTNTTVSNDTSSTEDGVVQNDIGIGSDVGGTIAMAAGIGPNETYEATIGDRNDDDAYRLFVDPGTHLMLDVTVTGDTSVFVELVTENGIVLDSIFPAGGETLNIDYQFNNRADATYVLRFSADNTTRYRFTANTEKQMEGGTEGDAGDTHAEATLITTNTPYNGSLGDEDKRDYYYFTPVAGQPFSVEIRVAEGSTSVMAEWQIIDSVVENFAFPAGGETAVLPIDSATGDTYVLALYSDGFADYSFILQGQSEAGVNPSSGLITLNKSAYESTEAILVTLNLPQPLSGSAWVGIVPSDTPHGDEAENDAVDVTYEYVTNAVNGQITLYAPSVEGQYDVRLFDDDDGGIELDSVSISVVYSNSAGGSDEPPVVDDGGEGGDGGSSDSGTQDDPVSSTAGNDTCVVGTWRVANFSEYMVAMVKDAMEGQEIEISATDSGSLLLNFDGETMTMSEENFQVTMNLLGQVVPTDIQASGTASYTADGSIITGVTDEATISAQNSQQASFSISNVVGKQVSYTCNGDVMSWMEPFASELIFERVSE